MTDLELPGAAALDVGDVTGALATSAEDGLSEDEALRRLTAVGPNSIMTHHARPLAVFGRQLRNPLLILLVTAAVVSAFVGERTDALIIVFIVVLSVGLGFVNEYRSEKAVEELHDSIRHRAIVTRGGKMVSVDVTSLVPGDVVRLDVGDVVPADVRLLQVNGLECDEGVLTGESMPSAKGVEAVTGPQSPLDLASCAFMGTVVRGGTGAGVVVRTGGRTAFGQIAKRLGERPPETAFQHGLRDFSKLLVYVTAVLTVSIFGINVILRRPLLEAALFSLAIAVGLTPQLLPAIVTITLSTGARRLARSKVVVKRLVSIEDLGNVEVLYTDKTGTLTEGRVAFTGGSDASGRALGGVLLLGLLCNGAAVQDGVPVGGNPLDRALWESPSAGEVDLAPYSRVAEAPFDYERKLMSVLVDGPGGRRIVAKGAPEFLMQRCVDPPAEAQVTLDLLFDTGARVVAIASRPADGLAAITPADERGLSLDGFLAFTDPPKASAANSFARLRSLGVEVKIITGDNDRVAVKVCADLGIEVAGVLTGSQLAEMDDETLAAALPGTTIFARVTPEQKSRVIRLHRKTAEVGFIGDGVNDAVALHDADVGISVDSASDVAKDAADIVMLEKDLGVLAGGVVEGRRIFANTIKYVLMGTSSNFGNMFSAAGASLFLKFLPMLPTQILLNNLLYDVSEMTIPTDEVDEELLLRPSHWDTRFIRRFMMFFGPISSIYDFMTFGVMLWVFHAGPGLFRTGWFVESLATQSLVVFVIRTRRVPFFRSKPSKPLLATTVACALTGAVLPFTPLAHVFGFVRLPASFLGILVLMVVTYMALVELGKSRFFRPVPGAAPVAVVRTPQHRRVHRVSTRWSARPIAHRGARARTRAAR